MKDIDLSQLSTGAPVVSWDASIEEVLKVFEENPLYDTIVTVKETKPLGVIFKKEAKTAKHRKSLIAADLSHFVSKVRTVTVDLESLIKLLDLFNNNKNPIILVDKKDNYVGLIFYSVLLHYLSLFKETRIAVTQRIRNLLGQSYYLCIFMLNGTKTFKETYGVEKEKGLLKILYEDVKEALGDEVYISYEDKSVYALLKRRPEKEKIKSIMEEFHREFSLLYADIPSVFTYGMAFNLEKFSDFETLLSKIEKVKNRLSSIKEASCFIYQEIPQAVVICEHSSKDIIPNIREKIASDFKVIVEMLTKWERDTWEYMLYDIFKKYPYFELFYIINQKGIQVSNNIVNPKVKYPIRFGGKGVSRADKNYFKGAMEKDFYMSDIYISQATDDFCITVSSKFNYGDKVYVLAGDINYREIHNLVKLALQNT